MRFSSRYKLIIVFSLIFVIGLALFRFTQTATHAVSTPTKVTSTSRENCGNWNIVSSSTSTYPNNILSAVTALSAKNVWAVGYSSGKSGAFHKTLIEHWDGVQWSLISSPNPGVSSHLSGVAALSAKNVWAVGYSTMSRTNGITNVLIEHWNGTQWNIVPSPNAGSPSVLFGVAALSAKNVWAVGSYYNGSHNQALIEHWDGVQWSIISNPNEGNQLSGIAAITANDIWAVGEGATSGNQALIEHWDGTQWSIISNPDGGQFPNFLFGVAAVSGNDVWAVGHSQSGSAVQTLIEHWNGIQWSIISSPSPDGLDQLFGVTALSTNDVWAVGSTFNNGATLFNTLIEHWDGTQWTIVSSPNVASVNNTLSGVGAVPATTQAWAVGSSSNGKSKHPLIEFYC